MKNFILLTLLFGCSLTPKHRKVISNTMTYPEELDPYMEEYFIDRLNYLGSVSPGRDIVVVIKHIDGPQIGLCNRYGWGKATITLDRSWWNYNTYQINLELLYHEMGHCDLQYGHVEDTIMSPHLIGLFEDNKDSAINDFFNRKYMKEHATELNHNEY